MERLPVQKILIEGGIAYERIPYANVGFTEVETSRVKFIGDISFPEQVGTIFIEEGNDIRFAKLSFDDFAGALFIDGIISPEDEWINKESVCSYADIEIRDGVALCNKFEYADALLSFYGSLTFDGKRTNLEDAGDLKGILENFYGYEITVR